MGGYVYIITNKKHGVLYIGVTNNLPRRIQEHKDKTVPGFSSIYRLSMLVYYEDCNSIKDAIQREKQLKNWHRQWKINLIESVNKERKDLSGDL
ncbi:MAG: GIY-YIG nuclease family protein [Candidatus Absconditabacterales bacterium]